jgi:hypothetical protein
VTLRHRYLVAAPFVVVVIVVLVGGLVNSTDARARIVDDLTDLGVKDARITHGSRTTTTDASGEFTLTSVPRTSKYQIDAQGYLRTSAPTYAEEVRLRSLSVTIYAYDETKTKEDRVRSPQAWEPDGRRTIATGNDAGQIIIAPHPGKDAQVMICAAGFERKTITVKGVLMEIGLQPGGAGCPILPTPSPAPAPTPSPTGPAPSPSPSPTRSP